LSVERDKSVIVRAPEGTPEEKIHRAIEAKEILVVSKSEQRTKISVTAYEKGIRFR